MPTYRRFVVLGDSQSEGLDDMTADGPRGWADRFAEHLARTTSPGLQYANLAVRGCRATHVRHVQLPAALALEPDLASVVVGMNDVLRHDYDLDAVVDDVEATIAALRATGCEVVTMTFPDVARMLPVMGWLRAREATLNERLVAVAQRYDVRVLDLFPLAMCGDPAVWSTDRIHGSSEGHRRIAAGMAELFGLPGSDHTWATSAGSHPDLLTVVRRDAWWVATFLGPFLYRQLRGRGPVSSNTAKRPELSPVTAPDVIRPGRNSDQVV
ncbi:MAG: lysophospholipase [Nocardioidaceae bacterium]|nr:lysophospholipase [Nocardioidaceae bacterium]